MMYLNLGCGNHWHPDWVNIDLVPRGPGVRVHDLTRGIPVTDASCDVIYHSALLEHLHRTEALPFLLECHRVLKPGGILRVAVPDLEQICRSYLATFDRVSQKDKLASHDHEWMVTELIDQCVRERAGGTMLEYLARRPIPNASFVFQRIGEEGRQLVTQLRQASPRASFTHKVRRGWRRCPSILLVACQRAIIRCCLGRNACRAFEIGRFRLSGEVHRWMYDRVSLAQLLVSAGFESPTVFLAETSQIPDWPIYRLDASTDGTTRKPDSLFMEARKGQVASP